jgi:hypothetical protein
MRGLRRYLPAKADEPDYCAAQTHSGPADALRVSAAPEISLYKHQDRIGVWRFRRTDDGHDMHLRSARAGGLAVLAPRVRTWQLPAWAVVSGGAGADQEAGRVVRRALQPSTPVTPSILSPIAGPLSLISYW